MTDQEPSSQSSPQPPQPPSPPVPPAAAPARPPVRPSPFGRRWPGPGRLANASAVLATLTGAALIAAGIPLERPGVGWLLCGVAGVAALTVATIVSRRRSRSSGTGVLEHDPPATHRITLDRLFWVALTLALLAVGTFRAAGWLFALCLLTAMFTGVLAVTGGRSVLGLLLGLMLPLPAAFRAIPWAARGLAAHARVGRVAATITVSFGLLAVFGALFASADAAFANLLARALPEIGPLTVIRVLILFPLLALGLLGGTYLLAAPPDLSGLESSGTRRVRRFEWVVPLALLDLLFLAFVLVQITVLFGGAAHVLGESGPTFAQYARSGFWQLLLVTALTLLVLGAAARWAPRHTVLDRSLIRLLLGGLALLTLVVVASALYRMHVYQQAYGFTRLRILVSACELWLGLVFILVLIAGVRLRAAWLPRVVIGSAVLALLGLAALNPDRFIADQNIDRYESTGRIDISYLSGLSADAVPALDRLPTPLRDCALVNIADDLTDHPDGWRGWNLARTQTRNLLAADPPARLIECPLSRW